MKLMDDLPERGWNIRPTCAVLSIALCSKLVPSLRHVEKLWSSVPSKALCFAQSSLATVEVRKQQSDRKPQQVGRNADFHFSLDSNLTSWNLKTKPSKRQNHWELRSKGNWGEVSGWSEKAVRAAKSKPILKMRLRDRQSNLLSHDLNNKLNVSH